MEEEDNDDNKEEKEMEDNDDINEEEEMEDNDDNKKEEDLSEKIFGFVREIFQICPGKFSVFGINLFI